MACFMFLPFLCSCGACSREEAYLELGDTPTPEILRVNLAQVIHIFGSGSEHIFGSDLSVSFVGSGSVSGSSFLDVWLVLVLFMVQV